MFITIEPCFAEGHILEAHIRNYCEYVKPDKMIFLEGLFPTGPENSLHTQRMENFKKLYTTDGKRSFDIEKMRDIVKRCQADYPEVEIQWTEMNYSAGQTTERTYYQVYTFPETLGLKPDDIIHPTETDLLFGKEEGLELRKQCDLLRNGEMMSLLMRQFFITPRVMMGHRHRRGAWRWGNGQNYKKFFERYWWEESSVKQLTNRHKMGWHYEWTRPGKYLEMRYEQTHKHNVSGMLRKLQAQIEGNVGATKAQLGIMCDEAIKMRTFPHLEFPDYTLEDHPIHIQRHPNLTRYLGG